MHSAVIWFLSLLATAVKASTDHCPCGWRISETSDLLTHRLVDDFSLYQDVDDMLQDGNASPFTDRWYIYDYEDSSDNTTIRLNAKYLAQNLRIRVGHLELRQQAYTEADRQADIPISVSGMQTRELDMLHGSFRIRMSMAGAIGGSCASFFWYHDNNSEIDIEAVTQGTSLVNNTINYTSHPSLDSKGNPIKNATLSVPMDAQSHSITTLKEHRFDCSPGTGVRYYLDGQARHVDYHNLPRAGGNLQLKLWADGNQWWSGVPSTTDVTLRVASITAYYNTTTSDRGDDLNWQQGCQKAGGPNAFTVCDVSPAVQLHPPPQSFAPRNTVSGYSTMMWCLHGLNFLLPLMGAL